MKKKIEASENSRNLSEKKTIRFNGENSSTIKKIAMYIFEKSFVSLHIGTDQKSSYIVLSKNSASARKFSKHWEIAVKILK